METTATAKAVTKIAAKTETKARIRVVGEPKLRIFAVFSIQLKSLKLEFCDALELYMMKIFSTSGVGSALR